LKHLTSLFAILSIAKVLITKRNEENNHFTKNYFSYLWPGSFTIFFDKSSPFVIECFVVKLDVFIL